MKDQTGRIVRHAACAETEPGAAFRTLSEGIGPGPFAAILVWGSPAHDIGAIGARMRAAYPDAVVAGCSTAGELCGDGYAEGTVLALALPRSHFCAEAVLIDRLGDFSPREAAAATLAARGAVQREEPDWDDEFALLLVDGVSMKEDRVVSALAPGLGTVQLFGGSAGDGLDFERTRVMLGGAVHENAAVLTLFRTRCSFQIFRFDNFIPTDRRMVVTRADPENRLVKEINAEPAAREYARIVGTDPDQLSPFMFAAHPVVVRVGGQHHVRAIRNVEENGDLRFFSAIDEGLVLTLATGHDMVEHLEEALGGLSSVRRPDTIIGFDCLLRRLDAESRQTVHKVSGVLSRHNVLGFSTYGEQFNTAHVNQTLTGVAIYPPEGET